MSYSKTTDFLKLPQWEGSDHPTFSSGSNGQQGDFNKAFSLIDSNASAQSSEIGTVKTTANSASSNASNALSLANSLSPRVDTLEDDLNDLQTTLGNVSSDGASALAQANKNATDIAKLQSDLTATTKTANSASSTASTANSTANTAKTNAATANTNANSALSKANANATSISTLQDDVSALQSSLNALILTVNGITSMTDANFKAKALDAIFPVGSIYLSVTNTSPQTFLGGTWSKVSSGKYFYTASTAGNTTGGSSTASFKLTADQSPWQASANEASGYGLGTTNTGFTDRVPVNRAGDVAKDSVTINLTPSYYTVIAWRRTK